MGERSFPAQTDELVNQTRRMMIPGRETVYSLLYAGAEAMARNNDSPVMLTSINRSQGNLGRDRAADQ